MGRLTVKYSGIVAAAPACLLAGCFPVPYPIPPAGYLPGSRHNVGEAVPVTIVPGQTSREEVLYTLGEPDNVAANQSFVYASENDRGGGGIAVINGFSNNVMNVTGHRILFRRLTVEFDAAGRVSSAAVETMNCKMNSVSDDVFTQPQVQRSAGSRGCPSPP